MIEVYPVVSWIMRDKTLCGFHMATRFRATSGTTSLRTRVSGAASKAKHEH